MGRAWRKEFDADVDRLSWQAGGDVARRIRTYKAYPPKGPHANKPKLTAYVVMDMASAPSELADEFAKFARKWNLGVCPVLNANGCLVGNGHEQENV